jgi:cardiolipin synthase
MSASRVNLPNAITVTRILLVPPFVLFLLRGHDTGALAVFAAAAISDFIDGFLARRLRQQTALGRFLDPLADKLLAGTAFILLALRHVLPDWLTVVVISRECVIVVGMVLLNMLGVRVEVAASRVGKWNTAFQLTTVCAVLLVGVLASSPWPPWLSPSLALLYIATATTTIISGFQYLFRGLRLVS